MGALGSLPVGSQRTVGWGWEEGGYQTQAVGGSGGEGWQLGRRESQLQTSGVAAEERGPPARTVQI